MTARRSPATINPQDVYEPEVIEMVQRKIQWCRERGYPERAATLIDKFRRGKKIYPCEYYMGPTKVIDVTLSIEDLTPPSSETRQLSEWAAYAGRISDIDPEVLRQSSIDDIKGLLIVAGVYDPNWETNSPPDLSPKKSVTVPKKRHPDPAAVVESEAYWDEDYEDDGEE